jgi:hypothetical protein
MTPLFSSQSQVDFDMLDDSNPIKDEDDGEDGVVSATDDFLGIRATQHPQYSLSQSGSSRPLLGRNTLGYADTFSSLMSQTQNPQFLANFRLPAAASTVIIKSQTQQPLGSLAEDDDKLFKVPALPKYFGGKSATQGMDMSTSSSASASGIPKKASVRVQKRFTNSPQKQNLSGEFLGRQRELRKRKQEVLLQNERNIKRVRQVSNSKLKNHGKK